MARKEISLSERLVVGADFKPEPGCDDPRRAKHQVRDQVLGLADQLHDTGVILKVNSALRLCGYELLTEIKQRGLKAFADLKLDDIPETLATDGAILAAYRPAIVTIKASAGKKGIAALKTALPETEVIAVTVLTSFSDIDATEVYGKSWDQSIDTIAERLALLANRAGADGFVASGAEAQALRQRFGNDPTINTPAVRPLWSVVMNDDQAQTRIRTPAQAITDGADRIIVARPIIGASDRRAAVDRTLAEIDQAA